MWRSVLDAGLAHHPPERRAADPKRPGGLGPTPVMLFEDGVQPLRLGGSLYDPGLWTRCLGPVRSRDFDRQVLRQDRLPLADGHSVFKRVLELPDVTRPRVAQQSPQRLRREAQRATLASTDPGEQYAGERLHVLAAFPQGRDLDRHDAQPVEEVFAEVSVGDGAAQVAVGCRDDPRVRVPRAVLSHALERALLEDAQKLDLQRKGHVSDFVQKEGPARGDLEAPGAVAHGARE